MRVYLSACNNTQKDYEFEKIKTDTKTNTTLPLNLIGAKLPNNKSRLNLHFDNGREKGSVFWKKERLCTLLRNDENTTFEEYIHVNYSSKHLSFKVEDKFRKYSSSLLTVVFIPCNNCAKCKKYFKS